MGTAAFGVPEGANNRGRGGRSQQGESLGNKGRTRVSPAFVLPDQRVCRSSHAAKRLATSPQFTTFHQAPM
jgi:hypothetical protein